MRRRNHRNTYHQSFHRVKARYSSLFLFATAIKPDDVYEILAVEIVEPPFIQLLVERKGGVPEWNWNTTKVSNNPNKIFTATIEVKQKFRTVQSPASEMRIRNALSHRRFPVAKTKRPIQHGSLSALSRLSGLGEICLDTSLCCLIPLSINMSLQGLPL
ncbi:hypothetical protein BofuT4_P116600.1 [Botrytis cinerea T4]|uniref:Uncharacterized protein n=1 Tax=Botryotinia fuckeliana (strain T4) TaxID=999810 RepID=G2Y0E5_BOTF4|nr:hypothetical protein BofuT4_P116600.1 [Botrytis cinerea T4]